MIRSSRATLRATARSMSHLFLFTATCTITEIGSVTLRHDLLVGRGASAQSDRVLTTIPMYGVSAQPDRVLYHTSLIYEGTAALLGGARSVSCPYRPVALLGVESLDHQAEGALAQNPVRDRWTWRWSEGVSNTLNFVDGTHKFHYWSLAG
jgi:hypothetical protein